VGIYVLFISFLLPSIDLPTSTEALEERRREHGWKIRQRCEKGEDGRERKEIKEN